MFQGLLDSLDKRLGYRFVIETLRRTRSINYISLSEAPPVSPGRITLLLVSLLILSGLVLTIFYNPTAEQAASSIAFLHRDKPLGWLVHNTHRWSALLLMVFVVLHALRVWLSRAYRYPRDINWWLGLCLLLLVIVMGGTGYLLRWDIKAFALMDLVISSLSSLSFIGGLLTTVILGGSEADVVPLYRGYALHVWFLPLLLILFVAAHIFVVWKQGLFEVPAIWRQIRDKTQLWHRVNLLPSLVLLIAVVTLSAITPHEGQAGPVDRSAWPHPDWLLMFYFLPFWFFKGNIRVIGTIAIPAILLIFLVLVPRLGREQTQKILIFGLTVFGVSGVLWLFGQVSTMGYQVPLQGCAACHRPTIVGGAPAQLSEFKIRDPDWLVFHLRDPQGSLLVPFTMPEQVP